MSNPNDGGPAFPQPGVYDASREQVYPVGAYYDAGGMSLRDYFAAKAMAAIHAEYQSWEMVAEQAYKSADAMLAQRARVKP